jgi:vancomycin resistance protein YoaR
MKKSAVKKVAAKKVATKKAAKKVVTKKVSKTVTKTTAKKLSKDNSFVTKTKMVSNHLVSVGSITSWEAIQKFRATRLSSIIFNLKKAGFIITTTNEVNGKSTFARYHFKGMKSIKIK